MEDGAQPKLIKQGAKAWNEWRQRHPKEPVILAHADLKYAQLDGVNLRSAQLHGADFRYAQLVGADLSGAWVRNAMMGGANLKRANLSGAHMHYVSMNAALPKQADTVWTDLTEANLKETYLCDADLYRVKLCMADLRGAALNGANLRMADLRQADLRNANLDGANFYHADLTKANLSDAFLENVVLVGTNISETILTNCRIHGISAWNLKGVPKEQSSLIITSYNEAQITVDDLQVAQFIYLLLNNQNVRNVIDTITSKAVLILGRFTDERKAVLDALHSELRKHNYLPILFDFNVPESRDITETVSTLAHMARFVIADITDAKSIPQELERIVPGLPSVPVQPILLSSQKEYGMYGHYKRYPWVLETYYYNDVSDVINSISAKIIEPLEQKFTEQKSTIK